MEDKSCFLEHWQSLSPSERKKPYQYEIAKADWQACKTSSQKIIRTVFSEFVSNLPADKQKMMWALETKLVEALDKRLL